MIYGLNISSSIYIATDNQILENEINKRYFHQLEHTELILTNIVDCILSATWELFACGDEWDCNAYEHVNDHA